MPDSLLDILNWGGGLIRVCAIALGIFILFWVAAFLLASRLLPAIQKRIDKDKKPIVFLLLKGIQRPLSVLLKLNGILFGVQTLAQLAGNEFLPAALSAALSALPPILSVASRISIVVAIAWALISSSDISFLLLRTARTKLDINVGQSVSRFLAAIFNGVVVAVAVVIILAELNYDINGLIAGLGLGGLTVALAAQDSAANFFGGLVLILERPFEIGDWITCAGIEGTVEDINLRSTKIRIDSGALTVMPNGTLSTSPITNWGSDMEVRRVDFVLNLEYATSPEQMQSYSSDILAMLQADDNIIKDRIAVRFADLGASSLDIRVIFYTSLPGFIDHLKVRERVNYSIMELAKKHGVQFAYPSQSLYVQHVGDGAQQSKA